jgi:Outer membrane protein beta-barrel domain
MRTLIFILFVSIVLYCDTLSAQTGFGIYMGGGISNQRPNGEHFGLMSKFIPSFGVGVQYKNYFRKDGSLGFQIGSGFIGKGNYFDINNDAFDTTSTPQRINQLAIQVSLSYKIYKGLFVKAGLENAYRVNEIDESKKFDFNRKSKYDASGNLSVGYCFKRFEIEVFASHSFTPIGLQEYDRGPDLPKEFFSSWNDEYFHLRGTYYF